MSNAPFDLNSLRNTPLDPLLERLGAEIDPKDKHNWRTPVGRMTVTGPKFFNPSFVFLKKYRGAVVP